MFDRFVPVQQGAGEAADSSEQSPSDHLSINHLEGDQKALDKLGRY